MRRECVDFHLHYKVEDENLVFQIIDNCKNVGIVAMTLLLKSEVSRRYQEFVNYGRKRGISIVSGVECYTKIGKKDTDLICLGFDWEHSGIQQLFDKRIGRNESAELAIRQKRFLEQLGFSFTELDPLSEKKVQELLSGSVTEKAIEFCRIAALAPVNQEIFNNVKKENPHLWDEAVQKYGHVDFYKNPINFNGKFLWMLFFSPEYGSFPPSYWLYQQIISVIHHAGGVVLYSPEGKFSSELFEDLVHAEIDGIMGWHGSKLGLGGYDSKEDIPLNVFKRCLKEGLLVLGGSDAQGLNWEVGVGDGKMFISKRRYRDLEKRLEYIRNLRKQSF